jgi:DNA-binding PadR family transcriptional regulator
MTDPTLLILSSLAHGDKHGHAMILDIEDFAGVRLGPGTLYGAITRLEERGLIRPLPASDRRQPYRITASGETYLREQLVGLAHLVSTGLGRLRNA